MLQTTGNDALVRYNPKRALQEIALLKGIENYYKQAKDFTNLFAAVSEKLQAQARYICWRDSTLVPSRKVGGPGRGKRIASRKSVLPTADPGHDEACRWRKRLCSKQDGLTIIDVTKLEHALKDAQARCLRVCEAKRPYPTMGGLVPEWYTPPDVIEAARKILGRIDLDPATCKTAQKVVRARTYFADCDEALRHKWRGTAFVNPPYLRQYLPQLVDKLTSELEAGNVTAAILLVNASTDAKWFHVALKTCSSVCFSYDRIRCLRPDGTPGHPLTGQTIFYFGGETTKFESCFARIGTCLRMSRAYNGTKGE